MSLYMAGARMITYYPVSIVVHSMGLNITLQSYNGSMDFGLIACRQAMPDLAQLAKYMVQAHQELQRLTPKIAAEDVVAKPAAKRATKAAAKRKARATSAA